LEAMKMEQTIHAPCSGKIMHVGVEMGDTVSAGELLVEIV